MIEYEIMRASLNVIQYVRRIIGQDNELCKTVTE